jgi:type IV pilus assembly protein PilY1
MKKNSLLYFLALALVLLPFSANAQTMADYTCFPIFTTTAVTPNILIILDNSGSMNLMAYGYDANGYYHPDDFDPNITYYGYFDPTSRYSYANEFDRDAGGDWDGNFLNWLTMRRVDLARKVLVGGKQTARSGGGNQTLYGETPAQEDRKYFKFYYDSGNYTPYDNNHLYKISKGDIEVYSIDTPANFDYNADYKMYCNNFNGHDALCEDVVFWYNGFANQDKQSYDIYPRKAAEPNGACDYNKYDSASSLTGLTYVDSHGIKVKKEEAEEPDDFLGGNLVGILDRLVERESARFGLEFFNNDGSLFETGSGKDGGYIAAPITKKLKDDEIAKDMITDIQNTACNTWTPLAESFYVGVHYYRQDFDPYPGGANFTINDQNDPFNYDKYGGKIECGKNFILLITDGESTMDLNIPAEYQNYDGDGNDPGGYASSGSDYLDDLALWAHTNDMRGDLPDDQVITLYTVFAFGSGSQLLMDASKNGGFIDRDGDNKPDTVGDARGGEWSDLGSNIEWDENGDGIPDTYFEAPSGNELAAKLIAAITAILQRAASGTAVSILSTSSEGEGSLFQAFFKPTVFDSMREVKWVGYLNSLWVDPFGNLREDTVHDDAMVYSEDKIIRFTIDAGTGDTAIARYHDNDGDGMADIIPPATEPVPYETVLLSELDPQWEAGEKLALRDADRTIKTWADINGDGVVDAGEVIDFETGNATVLRPFLDAADDTEAANIISFIRGESVSGYRDRNITINSVEHVWKLGDIVYSTPSVVGKPMENYHQYYSDTTYAEFFTQWKERGVSVYVGANDGMLHAFKAGTFHEGDNPATAGKKEHGWYSTTETPATTGALGDERWAYIPYNLLPHLRWLADPDYTHVYYVDLKPKITDVRIFADDTNHPNGWGTILIGGMRLGGGEYTFTEDFDNNPGTLDEERSFRSAYFVLDITVPDSPVLLGEFTDVNLAFTASYPAIARLEATEGFQDPEDDEWFFIVGSGPTECDGSSDQDGYVFVFDLNSGQLVQTFITSESNAFMANPVTLDINLNYNIEDIYIGETYNDVSGKMYRISTRNSADPAVFSYKEDPTLNPWVMSTLFSSTTPITASPTASIDEDDNIWIYFGTGKYYSNEDKTDTTDQYFYGIKEPCPYGACLPADEVALADLYNATNIIVLDNQEVVGATATTWDAFVNEVQAEDGWYISLDTGGERVLNRPSVLGGVVLFAPFKPDDDVCSYGGTGSLYALYYETGTAYYKPILGTETYGDDEKSLKRISLDKGITSEIGLHVGRKDTSTGFIQQGSGSVIQVEVDPALNIKDGIVGWKQY